MRPTLGTSRPQRFVQYFERREQFRRSAVFFLWPPTEVGRNEGNFRRWPQKKHRPTKNNSHSVLPTKMSYGILLILFFWSPIAVGLEKKTKTPIGKYHVDKPIIYKGIYWSCYTAVLLTLVSGSA